MRPLEQGGTSANLVESRGVRATQSGGVGVVGEAEQRDVRIRLGDVICVDPGDVGDHEVGRLDPVRRLEAMLRQERLELAPDEEVDPAEEDRRHA